MYESQADLRERRYGQMTERDDDLWPPFGPGAAFREGAVRGQGERRIQPARRPQPVRSPHPHSGRGRPRGGLSRDEIVAAAIGIADRDGTAAISMRKIAQVLQAGAMSLYWHLASKEHLLELMLDAMLAEVAVPEPTGDWKADLRTQARSMREVLLRHTWVVDFIGARPPLSPNTLRSIDKMLASLDGLDLDTETAMNVLQTVNTYVSGAVLREFQEIRTQREQEQLLIAHEELLDKLGEWRRRLAAAGKFEHFLRMLDDNVDPDAESTRQERFEFGLDCVLEGVAAKIARG